MANTFNKSISEYKESLAKDLGYNSYKEYLQANKKDYSGNMKQRLEQGAGFKESFSGSMGESYQGLKKKLSPKNIAKTYYMNFFKGDDIFSAYMRGRLNKKKSTEPTKPIEKVNPSTPKMEFMESFDKKLVGRDKKGKFTKLTEEEQWEQQRKYGLTKLTALSPTPVGGGEGGDMGGGGDFAGLSGIAKDVMLIRNAVSQLLSFEREGKEQGGRAEQIRFLQEQDAREAALETSPTQVNAEVETTGGGEKKGGKGLLGSLMSLVPTLFGFLKTGILKAFKTIFKPSKLLKLLGKAFLIGTIIVSLFKGIMAGFDRWKETGSISEAIIAGLGAIVDFITFGLLGEEQVRKIWDTVGDFLKPIKDWIVDAFYNVKDWIVNNIGIPQFSIPIPEWIRWLAGKAGYDLGNPTIGPYYPFKENPKSAEDEFSKRPVPESQELKEVEKLSDRDKAISGIVVPNQAVGIKDKSKEDTKPESKGMAKKVSATAEDMTSPVKAEKSRDMQGMLGNFMGDNMDKLSPQAFGGAASLAETFFGEKVDRDAMNKGIQSDMGKADAFMKGGGLEAAFGQMGERSKDAAGSLDAAQSAISNKIKAGGVTPEPVTPFGAASSGEAVMKSSSEVETGQRAEMSQDSGSMINAPQIKNQSQNSSKSPPPAEVLNFEFANQLTWT